MCKDGGASLTVACRCYCYAWDLSRVSLSVGRPVCSFVLNWFVTEEMVEQLAKNINTVAVFVEMESERSRLTVR